jgi:ATP:ADP antiporter, AAA family
MRWFGVRFERSQETTRLLAMMVLFFLVVCAVGILRPIKNSLALDGLGSTNFYKVYLVSFLVVLFVPLFNRAADRVAWRWLLPGVALFFVANLVAFRLLYVEGSAAFGLAFYGWYDLFAAALVTQFFMATQLFFDARSAKQAYPLVIAGGSIGATLGSGITGFFAESVGTPNLLLVAAALITIFAFTMPWVWGEAGAPKPAMSAAARAAALKAGELRTIFANRHVRLIAGTVLLTILVKQLVDFQYNVLTKEVFDTRDAVSAFQGKFNAATQWLPLVVLAGLRPALRRWGVGSALLLLPACMLLSSFGLVVAFGLVAAVVAKGSETALRYSAERAGREILYVPVPEDIKLKAKAYIDVAVEKGIGKVLSALLLAVLLSFLELRHIAYVTFLLASGWFALALALRREYVRTLSRAIEGRFASLRGLFMTLTDASSLPVLQRALAADSPLRVGFALDLVRQAPASDIRPLAKELNALAAHGDEAVRAAALDQLARIPDLADEAALRARLADESANVRERAVATLAARHGGDASALLRELLTSDDAGVRMAALQHVVRDGGLRQMRVLDRAFLERRWPHSARSDPGARAELALAAAGVHDDNGVGDLLDPFLDDPDPRVLASALRSAALLGRLDCCDRMIAALREPATRPAAEDTLAALGTAAIGPLSRTLLDEAADATVRRTIPRVLARIPDARTVAALVRLVLAPETDQLLDYRTIKALGKLRARNTDLEFDAGLVLEVARREADAAAAYARAAHALGRATHVEPRIATLLRTALDEAWRERREGVFRCLGLIHPPDEVYRAYLAIASGSRVRRANALEWLEATVGHAVFRRLAAVLEPTAPVDSAGAAAFDPTTLTDDGDAWIAYLARALARAEPADRTTMELIEKVFLLQRIDLLRDARGAHLALLATIAEEVDAPAGTALFAEGEPTSAMFVVTDGEVALHGVGVHIRIGPEEAFGTWALIDEQPSPLEARTTQATKLLRIRRADFHDLLADHPELALGMLQGLARRVRSLVA